MLTLWIVVAEAGSIRDNSRCCRASCITDYRIPILSVLFVVIPTFDACWESLCLESLCMESMCLEYLCWKSSSHECGVSGRRSWTCTFISCVDKRLSVISTARLWCCNKTYKLFCFFIRVCPPYSTSTSELCFTYVNVIWNYTTKENVQFICAYIGVNRSNDCVHCASWRFMLWSWFKIENGKPLGVIVLELLECITAKLRLISVPILLNVIYL